jgi:hypothetical protein
MRTPPMLHYTAHALAQPHDVERTSARSAPKAPRVSQQLVAVTDAVVLTRARAHAPWFKRALWAALQPQSAAEHRRQSRSRGRDQVEAAKRAGTEASVRPSTARAHTRFRARAYAHQHAHRVAKRTSPRRLRCAHTIGARVRECAYCCRSASHARTPACFVVPSARTSLSAGAGSDRRG